MRVADSFEDPLSYRAPAESYSDMKAYAQAVAKAKAFDQGKIIEKVVEECKSA